MKKVFILSYFVAVVAFLVFKSFDTVSYKQESIKMEAPPVIIAKKAVVKLKSKVFEPKIFGKEIGRRIHTVKAGESLIGLARKYRVHEASLREWNGLGPDEEIIHPKQELVIREIKWPKHNGIASWYGPGFDGRFRADGHIYYMEEILVAHRDLPLHLRVKVTNLKNKRYIIAEVSDRGPFIEGRVLDLSLGAARKLRAVRPGLIRVSIEPVNT